MNPKDKLIVALDVDSKLKAEKIVDLLKGEVRFFKIGLELFSSEGPGIVEAVRQRGCEVFLDLKFHDIPNTVSRAALSVMRLGAYMFNVHALGGYEMMQKAAEACKVEAERLKIQRPKILAVTILTSMDKNSLERAGISDNIEEEVLRLAMLAVDAGLDGVVASPKEAQSIRMKLGQGFLIVTPGVRPLWAVSGDQKRVMTPKDAVASGADFIVVGRPVIEAPDPVFAAKEILKEIRG